MIRLELLGGVDVVDAENPRASTLLRQPKCLALLVYLVLAGPGVFRSRDAIFALLWPESDEHRARTALNQVLYRLRKSVGAESIVTRGDGEVGVAPGAFWCDATAFLQALEEDDAEAALELYRDDLLPAYFLDDAPDFERWVDEQRTRLRHEARLAAWRLAQDAADAGLAPAAAHWARRSAELSYDDESSLQELLRLLARVGDRSGALHAYREFARRLARDFDAEPAEETRRLMETIRAQSGPAVAVGDEASGVARITGSPVPTSSARSGEDTSPPQPAADAASRDISSPTESSPLPPRAPGVHRVRRSVERLVAATAIFVCIGTIGVVLARENSSAGHRSQPARTRIVVGDFTELGADSRPGMLGPAIRAAVVGRLAAVPAFDVASADVSPRSSGNLSRTTVSPGFLVAGSVLRSGTRVRVNVALVDAAAERTLRTTVLERDSRDSMALVDDLAREVASMVRLGVGREVRLRALDVRSVDGRARRLAAEALAERERARDLERDLERNGWLSPAAISLLHADTLLRQAEAIAPSWGEPMVERARVGLELAMIHSVPTVHDPLRARTFLELGIGEAERAVADDRDDAAALETLGLLSYWYWLEIPLAPDSARLALAHAVDVLRSAVEVDPQRASAWDLLSAALYTSADYTGAYVAALRAYQTDAYLDGAEQILNRLFLTAYEMGDDALARSWCDEIDRRFRRSWTGVNCRLTLMAWGEGAGDAAAARGAMRIVAQSTRQGVVLRDARPRLYMLAAAALARAGLRDSAEFMMLRARADAAGDPEILPLEAGALLLLGRSDSAAARLAQYLRERPLHRAGVACSRRFAPLRQLDRHHQVFAACGVSAKQRERRPGM